MSGVTSGGGGGALHQDGDPVSVQLGPQESVTVPTGETWVATVHAGASRYTTEAWLNGTNVATAVEGTTSSTTTDVVLTSGDRVFNNTSTQYGGDQNGVVVTGWSV